MANTGRILPDFDEPPVVETALGVEFAPLEKWAIPHFGLFWHEIRSEYPRFEVQPPLVSQIEKFGKEARQPQIVKFEILSQPPVRCWFIDKSERRLLQVQNDRFIHNWRKVGSAETYPHYETIRPIFEREWSRFCRFLESNDLGTPEVRQCEITYVNHLERGKGWQTFADLADVISCWSQMPTDASLAAREAIDLTARYLMPNNQGRLYIQLQSVIRHADAKEILQLTLTARARPATSDITDVLTCLDLGREWVVQSFVDFTTTKMHELWKRKKGT
jgi:uncharacterized protein (TIGR04255 family)